MSADAVSGARLDISPLRPGATVASLTVGSWFHLGHILAGWPLASISGG